MCQSLNKGEVIEIQSASFIDVNKTSSVLTASIPFRDQSVHMPSWGRKLKFQQSQKKGKHYKTSTETREFIKSIEKHGVFLYVKSEELEIKFEVATTKGRNQHKPFQCRKNRNGKESLPNTYPQYPKAYPKAPLI